VRLPGSVLQGILARGALVFLRLYLGIVFLYSAWFRITAEHPTLISRMTLPAVLPWVELLVGVLLVLGMATRFAAALAAVLLVNYMLAAGQVLSLITSSQLALAAIALALLIGAAGRTFGVDSVLARRWPRSPLW
jgi:uncharacterized membrane protein YphA (DoxX/SURF4 family)